jgi:hypothetical protein
MDDWCFLRGYLMLFRVRRYGVRSSGSRVGIVSFVWKQNTVSKVQKAGKYAHSESRDSQALLGQSDSYGKQVLWRSRW